MMAEVGRDGGSVEGSGGGGVPLLAWRWIMTWFFGASESVERGVKGLGEESR